MIPFGILQGELRFKNMKNLEISVHELSDRHILIRLPAGYMEASGHPESMVLYFYSRKLKKYEKTVLNKDSFYISKTAGDKYSESFRISIKDQHFTAVCREFSKEYLEYIDLKLYEEDRIMSHVMTEGRYPEDWEDVYEKKLSVCEAEWSNDLIKETELFLKGKKLYFSLETPQRSKDFLMKGTEGFPYELGNKLSFDGVVIGNSFCPNLFPDKELFVSLIKKASEYDFNVIISVPPVPESKTDNFISDLSELTSFLKEFNKIVVFQFGDHGTLSYFKDNFKNEKYLQFEKGILLHRIKRDPRKKYLKECFEISDGSDKNIMISDDAIFGPYYQTNTGTFCPLHALMTTGTRSKQSRVFNCERYCEKYYLRYPDHLMMKGEGNSLFGFSGAFLTDKAFYSSDEWVNCKKVVINV